MDKKISVLNLVEELAQQCNMTQTAADEFIRTFFVIIEEGLATEGIVKIKGWGTFKLSEVNDRESVDVNNGERIIIKGYRKVSFVPDATLKDFINRPFSQFETTELNDEYPLDDELIDNGTDSDNDNSVEELQDEAVTNEKVIDEPTKAASEAINPASDTTQVESKDIAVDTLEKQAEDSKNDVDEVANDENDDLTGPVVNKEYAADKKEETADIPEVASSLAQVPAETESSIGESKNTEATSDENVPANTESEHTTVEGGKEKKTSNQKGKHRASWKYWLPILLLVLLACCLFIYFFFGDSKKTNLPFQVSEKDKIKVETIDFEDASPTDAAQTVANAADTIISTPSDVIGTIIEEKVEETDIAAAKDAATDSENVLPEQTSEKTKMEHTESRPQKASSSPSATDVPCKIQLTESDMAKSIKDITLADTTSYIIDGTFAAHELQPGETIIRLAQVYYGDKRLWPYIVKYNWMKNPDNVHVGTVINIPRLKNK